MTYLIYLRSASIKELQMPHFEVYEGGNIEFLLFKNSVSFAVFGPKRNNEGINFTFLSSKQSVLVAPIFRKTIYLTHLSSANVIELQMPYFEVYEGGYIEFLLFKNSVSFAVFGPIRKNKAINSTFPSSKQ